jgi:NhaP-type Na+/H+ or K+/H+ antiporter
VNIETAIYGLIFGLVIGLVAWRFGVRPSPWREALAGILLYVAISLPLLAAGVGTESVTIALIASVLLIGAWKRFAHRPI